MNTNLQRDLDERDWVPEPMKVIRMGSMIKLVFYDNSQHYLHPKRLNKILCDFIKNDAGTRFYQIED